MMDSDNQTPNFADATDISPGKATRQLDTWGLVLRIGFFAFLFIAAEYLAPLLNWAFGKLVAGTVGLCLGGLVANVLTMRIFDQRPLSDIGLEGGGLSARNFFTGIVYGGGAAGLMLLMPILGGAGHLVPKLHSDFQWSSLVFFLFMILLAAAGEEMIFRGYAFQILLERLGTYATVLPIAILFGLLHANNPNVTGLAIFNTILWGVILGYAFVRSRDLWLPIGLHFGWNAVLPLFGVNLSGFTIDLTRYEYRWDVLPLWSGGDYGPEGGLLTTIFAIGVFYLLVRTPIKAQTARIAVSLNEVDPLLEV
jgi:membrane protease YdiL (CAAX protease family)